MRYGVVADVVQCSGGRPAEDVPEHKLHLYLCEVARDKGKIYPRACRICESPCKYGKRYLKMLEERKERHAV